MRLSYGQEIRRNELKFNPRNIVYLCSNDNYVTVVTVKGDIPGKVTVRGTLKSAESELQQEQQIYQVSQMLHCKSGFC